MLPRYEEIEIEISRIEIIKSVSKNIQLSKELSHQSASLHPELPQGLLKVSSYSSMGFRLQRQMANAFVVQTLMMLLVSANL